MLAIKSPGKVIPPKFINKIVDKKIKKLKII